jgi:hypothetical protein
VSELNSPVPERRNDELLTLVGKVALMIARRRRRSRRFKLRSSFVNSIPAPTTTFSIAANVARNPDPDRTNVLIFAFAAGLLTIYRLENRRAFSRL